MYSYVHFERNDLGLGLNLGCILFFIYFFSALHPFLYYYYSYYFLIFLIFVYFVYFLKILQHVSYCINCRKDFLSYLYFVCFLLHAYQDSPNIE